MEGYWEQPEATADAASRDGWFHTGDGGFIDDENYLTIADRKKDVIISGGENVSSIEVEDCIFSHPAVAEVAVIGVPAREVGRDGRGARRRLRRVRRPPRPSSSPTAASASRTTSARPSVEFRDELARTATGKLQKFKLRAPYWEGRERLVKLSAERAEPCPRATRSSAAAVSCARRSRESGSCRSRSAAIRAGRRPPEPGTMVEDVSARGKHLLIQFGDGQVLHTHMQMTGAWHVYAKGERWRRPGHTARVVLEVEDGTVAVCFAAPLVELRSRDRDVLAASPAARAVERLGPDLCEAEPDLDEVLRAAAVAGPRDRDRRRAARPEGRRGIGNVYKSEVCWIGAGVAVRAPRHGRRTTHGRLFATAHRLLRANLGRAGESPTRAAWRSTARAGRPCYRVPRADPPHPHAADAERVTFWCPTCQPERAS